ncbi:MAG: Dps family protein [Acidimicrobiia bacterium]
MSSERQASFTVPGLSQRDGRQVADALQERLCSLIDLGLTLKHIHWNVVGPSFIGVHEMLDPQYAGVQAMVDALAERVATLGGVPSGLPGRVVAARTWDDYALGRADTQAHLAALDVVYSGVISAHRLAIEQVGEVDPVSEDLLIGQTGVLEQYHWFVRSHLADWAGGLANAGESTEAGAARAAVTKERRTPRTPRGRATTSAKT